MKTTFVSWTKYNRRSELLARSLGATLHFVSHGREGEVFRAPLRYLIQGIRTWKILAGERPDVVFVQNPPIFSVLVVYLHCKAYKARYVIDSHTSAFLSRKWQRFQTLHRWLSRRACLVIVHNKSQEKTAADWGCDYLRIGFTPGVYPAGDAFPMGGKLNIAVPSTFHDDEPLEFVFEAAGHLNDIDFYITGDSRKIAPALLEKRPANCYLTGFLSYNQYIGLLRGVDLVMDLTTRNHTVLMGAFEAISLGKPLIVSDWPVLLDYFSMGTVHVPNTVEGICRGIQTARIELNSLQKGIQQLQVSLNAEWNDNLAQLNRLVFRSI